MTDLHGELVSLVAERVRDARGPGAFLLGVAGGVAVGKSTLARALAEALGPPVQIVATDGFLRSNGDLAAAGLIQRKGFPESYDITALHGFLDALAAGQSAAMPVYSHVSYDIMPGETRIVDAAGVVIVEGVNVLQTEAARRRFGLSLYVDAEAEHVKAWYLKRLDGIIENEPNSLIAQIQDADLRARLIEQAWTQTNLVNLRDHIAPSAAHADVIVRKAADHSVAELIVRKAGR